VPALISAKQPAEDWHSKNCKLGVSPVAQFGPKKPGTPFQLERPATATRQTLRNLGLHFHQQAPLKFRSALLQAVHLD
jgi:hypothetical protein